MIFKVQFGKQIHLINSNDKQKIEQILSLLPTVFKSLPPRYSLSYLDEDGDEITLKNQSDYQVLLHSNFKTARITIRESNEEFMEVTNQVQIQQQRIQKIEEEISEIKIVEDAPQLEPHYFEEKIIPQNHEIQYDFEPEIPQIDDSLIEEKLKKLFPSIISQIKAEITEQIKEKSRAENKSSKNEPIIIEEPIIVEPQQNRSNRVIHQRVNCDGCGQKGIVGIRYKCAVCADFDFCEKCQATIKHDHPFLKIKTLRQTPIKIIAIIDDEEDTFEVNGQRTEMPAFLGNIVNQGFNIVEGFLNNQNNQKIKDIFEMCRPTKQEEKVETKVEEKAPVVEKKEQPKVEKIVEEPKVEEKKEVKVEPERMVEEVSYEKTLQNANYLADVFSLPYEKCIKYAEMFPKFSKEELLDYCITLPGFFNN